MGNLGMVPKPPKCKLRIRKKSRKKYIINTNITNPYTKKSSKNCRKLVDHILISYNHRSGTTIVLTTMFFSG